MSMGHLGVLTHGMRFENALFRGDAVNVHGAVATLGCNVFVERIPGDALDIVAVLRNFLHTFAVYNRENSRSIVCAPRNNIISIWTPG